MGFFSGRGGAIFRDGAMIRSFTVHVISVVSVSEFYETYCSKSRLTYSGLIQAGLSFITN